MKITGIRTHIVMPIDTLAWVFVEVDTDEGLNGLGECTEYIGNPHLVRGLEAIKPLVIGTDPRHIEEIWQRLFHAYSSLNGRGYISHLISAIDIALCDLRGKMLGVPIYDLLGGSGRDSVPLYTHVRDQWHSDDLNGMVSQAKQAKEAGLSGDKDRSLPSDPSSWIGVQRCPSGGTPRPEIRCPGAALDGSAARGSRSRLRTNGRRPWPFRRGQCDQSFSGVGAHRPGVVRGADARRKRQRLAPDP